MIAPVAVAAAPAISTGAGLAIGAGASVLGGIAGGKSADKAAKSAQASGQAASSQIGAGLNEAQGAYQSQLNFALEALAEGEVEASDEIMAGLGMAIEERTKFFDIAKDNVQWVADFGQARKGNYSENMQSADAALGQSKQFLNQYKELIFNPDSIYDSEVYKSIKDRTVKEWGNFYSGKGLLGGNAQEAMVDRIAGGAYNYLTGERNAALAGVEGGNAIAGAYQNAAGQDLNAINSGADAAALQSNLAFQTGDGNANNYMEAGLGLAGITQAFNPAAAQQAGGQFQSEQIADARSAQANATLAGSLGAASNRNNITTGLISAGTELGAGALESFLKKKSNDGTQGSAADASAQTKSSYTKDGFNNSKAWDTWGKK